MYTVIRLSGAVAESRGQLQPPRNEEMCPPGTGQGSLQRYCTLHSTTRCNNVWFYIVYTYLYGRVWLSCLCFKKARWFQNSTDYFGTMQAKLNWLTIAIIHKHETRNYINRSTDVHRTSLTIIYANNYHYTQTELDQLYTKVWTHKYYDIKRPIHTKLN